MISAGMMVKNEEARLADALGSVLDIADEVVIVDTGSTDRTIEIIESFRALVSIPVHLYRSPWREDFSYHRNEVQGHCSGDWIFILDGDEIVEHPGNMRELIQNAPDDVDAYGVLLNAEMDSGALDSHHVPRAYRKSACRWQEPIHNQLVGYRKVLPSTAIVRSYYVGTLEDKAQRSIPMLEKLHGEEPHASHAPFFLAKTFRALGDMAKTRYYCEILRESIPDVDEMAIFWAWLVQSVAMMEGYDAADPILDEALARHPKFAELWHLKLTSAVRKWSHYAQAPGKYIMQSNTTAPYVDNLPAASAMLGLPLKFTNIKREHLLGMLARIAEGIRKGEGNGADDD